MIYLKINKNIMINLIWQTDNNPTNFHYDYITKVLFKNINYINHFDNKSYNTFLNNSIIIYSCMNYDINDKMKDYLEKYKSLGLKFIIFHLSDEKLNMDCCYYDNAQHIFRHYYNDKINDLNITTLPLGFASGYMNDTNNINLLNERDILITFIGQVKSDRQDLINNLNDINNKFLYLTTQWDCPTALSPNEVIEIYKRTIFVPCPMGWNHPDSHRIFEALEWGCIPIIKKYNGIDYFKYIFGEHPLPVLDDWSKIKDLMDELKNNELLLKINKWYKNYMNTLSENISKIVNEKLSGIKKLTILIPYRNREENLKVFIPYFHNFMKINSPDIPYEIVIIEQGNNKLFNRGFLFNIGYNITSGNTDYYALHDVDLLPLSSDYSYYEEPHHLFVNSLAQNNNGILENTNRESLYKNKGGVLTVSKEIYRLANGHSNNYWGWGLEDDDFSFRLHDINHHLQRYGIRMNHGALEGNDKGYYIMLGANSKRYFENEHYKRNYEHALGVINKQIDWKLEGLNTTKFNIIDIVKNDNYTKYIIDFENDVK